MFFQSNQGNSLNEDAEPEAKAAESLFSHTLTLRFLFIGLSTLGLPVTLV